MHFVYRGFTVAIKHEHGSVRAIVLDPAAPARECRSVSGRDPVDAADAARAYIDGVTDAEQAVRSQSDAWKVNDPRR
jgi:hypothetical protein